MKSTYILLFAIAILVYGCKSTQTSQTGQSKYYNLNGDEDFQEITEYNESMNMNYKDGLMTVSMENLVLMKGDMDIAQAVSYDVKIKEDTIRMFWIEYKDESMYEMAGEATTESVDTDLPGKETIFYKDEKGLWDIKDRDTYSEEDLLILLEEIISLNSDDDPAYPDKIAIGEEYQFPKKAVRNLLGEFLDKTKTEMFTIKLVDVIEKENDKMAILDCTITAEGSFTDEDGIEYDVTMELSGPFHRSLSIFEDTYGELKGTMVMTAEVKEMGETLQMDITAPITLTWALEPIEYNH